MVSVRLSKSCAPRPHSRARSPITDAPERTFGSGRGRRRPCLPQKKWGPALLPAPTAPSEGYAGVRNLVHEPEGLPTRFSILAHQLRRRFPTEQLPLARSPIDLPDCAARRFAGLSTFPASASGTEVPRSQNRPMFRGPSWVNHSCVPLCSPFPTRSSGSRVALEKIDSSGASSRLAPIRTRKLFPLPAGGDRTFGHLPHPSCRCRLSGEAGTAVPITCSPCTSPPSRESEKCGTKPVDNGDIGHNRRNLFRIRRIAPLGCRFVPLRLPRPSA